MQIRWIAPDGSLVRAGDKVIELDNSAIVSTIEDLRASVDGRRNEVERQKAANLAVLAERRFEVDRQRVELEKAGIWADLPAEVLPHRELRERQLAPGPGPGGPGARRGRVGGGGAGVRG